MQVSSRFTIAVHLCACVGYFEDSMQVTSSFLAGSIGVNPVVVREAMRQLKQASIIDVSRGKSGIRLAVAPESITLLDIYRAVRSTPEEGLFRFHGNPSSECPVGGNIHRVLDGRLEEAERVLEQELAASTLADVLSDIQREVDSQA